MASILDELEIDLWNLLVHTMDRPREWVQTKSSWHPISNPSGTHLRIDFGEHRRIWLYQSMPDEWSRSIWFDSNRESLASHPDPRAFLLEIAAQLRQWEVEKAKRGKVL